MKNIIVPTDFSPSAFHALKYAMHLYANAEDLSIILLHAYSCPHPSGLLIKIDDIIRNDAVDSMTEEIKRIHELYPRFKGEIKYVIEEGEMDEVIERVVDSYHPEIIFMGTKGASGIKEVLIGSNAVTVIRKAIAPVCLIPDAAEIKVPHNVVLASDLAPPKKDGFFELIKNFTVFSEENKLTILNVFNAANKPDLELILALFNNFLPENCLKVEQVENENAVKGITDFLTNSSVDLLVMLPKRNNFFDKIFYKSVTNKVAMHIKHPLLTINEL